MENDKVLELMTKMYGEMHEGFKNVNTRLGSLETKVVSLESRFDSLESKVDKNTLMLEQMQDKIEEIAEVQENHYAENKREHEEIKKLVYDKVSLLETAVSHNKQENDKELLKLRRAKQ